MKKDLINKVQVKLEIKQITLHIFGENYFLKSFNMDHSRGESPVDRH